MEGIYLYIGGWLPMQWLVGASLAKKERTYARSELQIDISHLVVRLRPGERWNEATEGASRSQRGKEDVRLDGRQFESDGYAVAAKAYSPTYISEKQFPPSLARRRANTRVHRCERAPGLRRRISAQSHSS